MHLKTEMRTSSAVQTLAQTLSDGSKPRNQGLGQTDKTVWSSCRKVTQRRARDYKINKSDIRKKFLEIENLKRQGEKRGLEPGLTTEW